MINIKDNNGVTTIHLPNIGEERKPEQVENNYVTYGTYGREIGKIKDTIYRLVMDINETMPNDLNVDIINNINNKLDRIIAILERL